MNVTDVEQKRNSKLLNIFFTLSLLVHILFIFLYIYLKIPELLFIASVNSCIFAANFILLRKKKYLLSMQIGVIAITIAATISTFFLGWKSYYSFYLVASAIIVVNSITLQIKWKTIETTFILILFLITLIFTYSRYPIYNLDSKLIEEIGLFNLLAVVFSILFMQFHNFTEGDNLRKRLEEISEIDSLTGAYNRRFFNKYLDIELKRLASQVKYDRSREVNFGIAMIDIDDFKNMNDKYGHLVGDVVIAEVAQIIKAAIFERDILCRYGGEEFVVLFTSTSKPGAMIATEKIIRTVENYEFMTNKENSNIKIHITVSIGFASFDEEANLYRLLDIADKRLYTAKEMGKNRVVYE